MSRSQVVIKFVGPEGLDASGLPGDGEAPLQPLRRVLEDGVFDSPTVSEQQKTMLVQLIRLNMALDCADDNVEKAFRDAFTAWDNDTDILSHLKSDQEVIRELGKGGRGMYFLNNQTIRDLFESANKISASDWSNDDPKVKELLQAVFAELMRTYCLSDKELASLLVALVQGFDVKNFFRIQGNLIFYLSQLLLSLGQSYSENTPFKLDFDEDGRLFSTSETAIKVVGSRDKVGTTTVRIEHVREGTTGLLIPRVREVTVTLTDPAAQQQILSHVGKGNGVVITGQDEHNTYVTVMPPVLKKVDGTYEFDVEHDRNMDALYALAPTVLAEEDQRAPSQKRFLTGGESQQERVEKALRYMRGVVFSYDAGPLSLQNISLKDLEKQYNKNVGDNLSAMCLRGTNYVYLVNGEKKAFILERFANDPALKSSDSHIDPKELTGQIDAFFNSELATVFHDKQQLAVKAWIMRSMLETFSAQIGSRLSLADPLVMLTQEAGAAVDTTYTLGFDQNLQAVYVDMSTSRLVLNERDEKFAAQFKQRMLLKIDKRGVLKESLTAALSIPTMSLETAAGDDWQLPQRLQRTVAELVNAIPEGRDRDTAVHVLAPGKNPLIERAFRLDRLDMRVTVVNIAAVLDSKLTEYFNQPKLTGRGISNARRERAMLLQAIARACREQIKAGKLSEADAQAYLQLFCEFEAEHARDHNSVFNRTNRFGNAVRDAMAASGLDVAALRSQYLGKKATRYAFSADAAHYVAEKLKDVGVTQLRAHPVQVAGGVQGAYFVGDRRNKYEVMITSKMPVDAKSEPLEPKPIPVSLKAEVISPETATSAEVMAAVEDHAEQVDKKSMQSNIDRLFTTIDNDLPSLESDLSDRDNCVAILTGYCTLVGHGAASLVPAKFCDFAMRRFEQLTRAIIYVAQDMSIASEEKIMAYKVWESLSYFAATASQDQLCERVKKFRCRDDGTSDSLEQLSRVVEDIQGAQRDAVSAEAMTGGRRLGVFTTAPRRPVSNGSHSPSRDSTSPVGGIESSDTKKVIQPPVPTS